MILHEKTQTGTDAFNRPIYSETETVVENVLVEPASNDSVLNELSIDGKRVSYVLHIPMNDNHSWDDVIIDLPAPWNITVHSFGDVLTYDPSLTPLAWGKKVKVEKYG